MSRQSLSLSRRRFLQSTALGAATAAGVLQAPSVLRAQGAAVKVGILHPVSGALSYSGQQGRAGALLAIEEINAGGGIKGKKVRLVNYDDQGKTSEVGTAVTRLITQDNVIAVIGEVASSLSIAGGQIAQQHKVPMISPS